MILIGPGGKGISNGPAPPAQSILTSGDGGDDANFITILELGLLILEEANVLLIDIHIDEPTHGTGFVEQTFLETREASLEFRDDFVDGGGIHFYNLFVVGQLAQWSWDSYFFGHI